MAKSVPQEGDLPAPLKAAVHDEALDQAEMAEQWQVGDILEAQMMDPKYPQFRHTIHRVYVQEVLENDQYECKLLAFRPSRDDPDDDDDVDHWPSNLLHEVRDADLGVQWQRGQRVHVRIRNRKHDHFERHRGVWVKATIVRQEGEGRYRASHVDWANIPATVEDIFESGDIRHAW